MSDPDRVGGWLGSNGFDNVEIAGLERPFWLGDTADSAHDLIAGLMGWMIADLDPDHRRHALDDLKERITAHQTEDGVVFGSAACSSPRTEVDNCAHSAGRRPALSQLGRALNRWGDRGARAGQGPLPY